MLFNGFLINDYGGVTGQTINLSKSSITFGNKIDQDMRDKVQNILGIYNERGAGTYLGLPECFNGSKRDLLAYIQDKMKSRRSGWYARCLSLAGKEVLLKTFAMALLVYAISCFKLSKTTCDKLTAQCQPSGGIPWGEKDTLDSLG